MLDKLKPHLATIVITIIVLELWPRLRAKLMPS
jgi:hypothetical protein